MMIDFFLYNDTFYFKILNKFLQLIKIFLMMFSSVNVSIVKLFIYLTFYEFILALYISLQRLMNL